VVGTTRARRWTLLALLTVVGALALAPSASAGRLIQSGHDIDWHCATETKQCHFVQVALNYVRGGAPNPSKPVLVLDRLNLDVNVAINKAFGAGAVPVTIVDPRSATFNTTPIDTAHFSAIWVASDINCGGCDLNNAPTGCPSCVASTPDSTAIANRTDDISAFFNAGGGIIAGAGDSDATGFSGANPIAFSTANQPYYAFLATTGAANAAQPFTLLPLGAALGLTSSDVCSTCGTHNSFAFPPAGSQLKAIERDNAARIVTMVEDTDPPAATITSAPTGATSSTSATFAFKSNEGGSFQCRVDNAAFSACSSPRTVSGLGDGKHTFNVRAIDLVGNIQPTPAASSFCTPGGSEVAGNKVDENCDGFSAPFSSVEASIRYAFRFTRSSTRVTTLNLSRVTSKAKLKVTCRGKGCPFKSKSVKLKKGKAKLSKLFKRKRRRAKLRRGARIRISLTKKGLISKVYSFKVRRGALPSLATRCQVPGSKKLRTRCPTFK
jgi:hypothetical protein